MMSKAKMQHATEDVAATPVLEEPTPSVAKTIDLDDPALYLNRELTWLAFNRRVLREAEDTRNPLLERVKFLAIVSNNLDEFYMKRIGGIKQEIAAGLHSLSVDGRTPLQQLKECQAAVRAFQLDQRRIQDALMSELATHEIRIRRYAELSELCARGCASISAPTSSPCSPPWPWIRRILSPSSPT